MVSKAARNGPTSAGSDVIITFSWLDRTPCTLQLRLPFRSLVSSTIQNLWCIWYWDLSWTTRIPAHCHLRYRRCLAESSQGKCFRIACYCRSPSCATQHMVSILAMAGLCCSCWRTQRTTRTCAMQSKDRFAPTRTSSEMSLPFALACTSMHY